MYPAILKGKINDWWWWCRGWGRKNLPCKYLNTDKFSNRLFFSTVDSASFSWNIFRCCCVWSYWKFIRTHNNNRNYYSHHFSKKTVNLNFCEKLFLSEKIAMLYKIGFNGKSNIFLETPVDGAGAWLLGSLYSEVACRGEGVQCIMGKGHMGTPCEHTELCLPITSLPNGKNYTFLGRKTHQGMISYTQSQTIPLFKEHRMKPNTQFTHRYNERMHPTRRLCEFTLTNHMEN